MSRLGNLCGIIIQKRKIQIFEGRTENELNISFWWMNGVYIITIKKKYKSTLKWEEHSQHEVVQSMYKGVEKP